MSERNEYAPGEFCWVDLSTTDVDAAKSFYGDLLGIEAEAAPGDPEETGGYGFFMKGGKMLAGIGPVQSDEGHSAWSSYVKVEDADATAAKVKEAGGSVLLRSRRPAERCRTRRDAARSEGGVLRHRGAGPEPGRPAGQRARRLDLEQPADAGHRGGEGLLREGLRLDGGAQRRGAARRLDVAGRGPALAGGDGRSDGDLG